MSNKRIDEMLRESGPPLLTHLRTGNPDLYPYIKEAMEQYGLEQSKDGYKTAALAEHYRSVGEIDRLKELVKAQKELIAIYEKAITLGEPDVWELYLKIKELEK